MGILCYPLFAQHQIELTENSPDFPPNEIIIDLPKTSIDDNYSLILEWSDNFIASNDEILINQRCNDYVSFTCTVPKLYKEQSFLFSRKCDAKYILTFRCLDEKVSMEINDFRVHFPETRSSGGWEKVAISYNDLFKRNGETNSKMINTFSELQEHFGKIINDFEAFMDSPKNRLSVANSN